MPKSKGNKQVSEIDEGAFRYCWSLTAIDLPNSIDRISAQLFADCHELRTVTIPSTVTSIGECAFLNCYKIAAIALPNAVTSIGRSAFKNCDSLNTIYLPETISNVGGAAFSGTPWLSNLPEGLIYIGKVAYEFKGTMADNTQIELRDDTKQIATGAFWQCSGLTSINIPETVEAIGAQAFGECINLKSVNIPQKIANISEGTFYNCSSLSSVEFPEGLQSIGTSAFQNCGFTSIELPDKLTTIGDHAFYLCNGIESIHIPSSVTNIGENAFWNGTLKSITIAVDNPAYDSRNNCNAIIESATNTLIFGCEKSFVPDGIEHIANFAFCGCEGLMSISMPESLKDIGEFAFDSCPLLSYVELNEGLEILGKQAFCSCPSIKEIVLPSTLIAIGQHAFASTGLTSVTSNIENPFAITLDVFNPIFLTATLYVPAGTKEKYEGVDAWNRFSNIVEVTKQCGVPTIAYHDGQLRYECDTDGAEFITSISDADVRNHLGSIINLTATYVIKVYAKAIGYKNSDAATATLCWIEAEPKKEGIEDGVAQIAAHPVLIQRTREGLSITGSPSGVPILIYDLGGRILASATANDGETRIDVKTDSRMVVVQVGNTAAKVFAK